MSIEVQIDNKLPSCGVVSVFHSCYTKVSPSAEVDDPQFVAWSDSVAELLDLDLKEFERPDFLHFFSGASPLVGGHDHFIFYIDYMYPRIEEPESLSDIDDIEVDLYLHSEEEKKLKKIIWEEMNKEYLEEQAAKEVVALAAKKAYEAAFANCSGDVKAAQRLAAAAAEAVAKSKKEKQQKRAADLKNMGAAQTAHKAAKQALDRKWLCSKIRLDALEKLFDEFVRKPSGHQEKRTEAESDHDDKFPNNIKDDTEASWSKTKLLQQRVQSRDYEGLANYLMGILT
ncbi:hypothetical protein PHJA_000753200 [Phtheirospermum japonicum]|uniref:Selenoprotein O n=1 Tax=Phtheirospermum japonicum TaxID=374723 RepID=A0A830BPD5_9LAMI|nr:hypothetical protein PHJA_000753200 [Phtheirospermum japonicum]